MPSRMPWPARSTETMQSFLPASAGARMGATGVSMSINSIGRSRVTS